MAILRVRSAAIAFLAAMVLLISISSAYADDAQPLQLYEEKIKSGLIYNFLKYTDWPKESAAPNKRLQVCLVGAAPVDQYLYPLKGRIAGQRGIDVKQVSAPVKSGACDLLFIHRDRESAVGEIIQNLKGQPVLTVSDISGFASAGGMVEFSMQDNHVGFLVNRQAVASAGLRVEDRLLKLSWNSSGNGG